MAIMINKFILKDQIYDCYESVLNGLELTRLMTEIKFVDYTYRIVSYRFVTFLCVLCRLVIFWTLRILLQCHAQKMDRKRVYCLEKHNYPGSLARTATKMAIQPAGREENCRTYR